jgi:D-sedoheptulose 7-phosphate isomerase
VAIDTHDRIREAFEQHRRVLEATAEALRPAISDAARRITDALRSGGKVLVLGNGGSAADAQHFAAELVGRYRRERRAWPAVALTTDTSALTAIGNDYGFDEIFARQVRALAVPGDVVLALSTSGNSENVVRALVAAGQAGAFRIGMGGKDGGRMRAACDLALIVPSADTARIQEAHITILHVLCDVIEEDLCDDGAR